MSVNLAWQGRRFKTSLYKTYEEELLWILKTKKYKKINGYVEINYKFYVKNFKMCDVGNFEKPLNDILVKGELIDDDRFIKRMILEKFQSDNEYMEIKIKKV